MELCELYSKRPFMVRNADEFGLEEVVDRFVSPLTDIESPYEYESTIVRGKKGTGKTMYLRANHAVYQHLIYSSLQNNTQLIIPVYLALSAYSHIHNPLDIYKKIVIDLCKALIKSYSDLVDVTHMLSIHGIMNRITMQNASRRVFTEAQTRVSKLSSDEIRTLHEQKVSGELGLPIKVANVKAKFDNLKKEELLNRPEIGIDVLRELNEELLGHIDAKLLILLDEVGSLNREFFVGERDCSTYEILMNQFRTSNDIRTKIAVYPDTGSDRINETRYGNRITLEDDITTEIGYSVFNTQTERFFV